MDIDKDMDIYYHWTGELGRFQILMSSPTAKSNELAPRYKFFLQRTLHRFYKANVHVLYSETGFIDLKNGVL
jgi:hypothetical protein